MEAVCDKSVPGVNLNVTNTGLWNAQTQNVGAWGHLKLTHSSPHFPDEDLRPKRFKELSKLTETVWGTQIRTSASGNQSDTTSSKSELMCFPLSSQEITCEINIIKIGRLFLSTPQHGVWPRQNQLRGKMCLGSLVIVHHVVKQKKPKKPTIVGAFCYLLGLFIQCVFNFMDK